MLLNANDGQGVPNLKFVIESDLDVVNAISLELYAAKDVDIRHIRIQGGQSESQFALGDGLFVIAREDKRFLSKISGAAAPSRPEAEFEKSNGHRVCGNHSEDANERLLTADLRAYVLAG